MPHEKLGEIRKYQKAGLRRVGRAGLLSRELDPREK